MTKTLNVYRPVRFTGGLYALTLVAVVTALALTATVFKPFEQDDDHLTKWIGGHVYLEVLQGYTYIIGLIILLCIHTFIHRHQDRYKLLNSGEVVNEDDSDVDSDDNDGDDGGEIEERLENPRFVTATSTKTTTVTHSQQHIATDNNQPALSHSSNEVNFYVRIGVLIFGTGCMTQGGFKLAHLHQQGTISLACVSLCEVLVTILCILFTFFQAFFLFKNHKIVIRTRRSAFKHGFAHLIATNVTTLIITIVREIETVVFPIVRRYNATIKTFGNWDKVVGNETSFEKDANDTGRVAEMGRDGWVVGGRNTTCNQIYHLSNKASSYLYPCTVQYCVIAVFILVKMYHQIGSKWPRVERQRVECVDAKKEIEFVIDDNDEDGNKKDEDSIVVGDGVAYNLPTARGGSDRRITIVDCDKAHKGLFAGLLVVVSTFIMMSCFFVFARNRLSDAESSGIHAHLEASYFFYALEYSLLLLSCLATLVAVCRFRKLGVVRMRGKKFFNTEKSLLILCYPSVVILQTFYVVATVCGLIHSHLTNDTKRSFLGVQEVLGIMTLFSCAVVVFNVLLQTCFIISAFKRVTSTYQQKRQKPGRALVTFLVFCNLALFIVAVFEHERIHYNLMQSSLFTGTFWNVLIRLILPFHILFRFISMASLTAIWKSTYTVSSYL